VAAHIAAEYRCAARALVTWRWRWRRRRRRRRRRWWWSERWFGGS